MKVGLRRAIRSFCVARGWLRIGPGRAVGAATCPRFEGMELPPPDPAKLLDAWMEWERGETPPGRVMSNLKTAGMRILLESLAAPAATGV